MANSVQTPVKEVLEMMDVEGESADATTAAHVQTPDKEKLEIEDSKKEPATDLVTTATEGNPIKEELDIEKLKEKSKDVAIPTTSGNSTIKEGVAVEDLKEGHGDDTLANKSDCKDDDKLQIDDKKGCKSKTQNSATAKKELSASEIWRRLLKLQRAKQLAERSLRNPDNYGESRTRKTLDDAFIDFGRFYCSTCKKQFKSSLSERCSTCDTILLYECDECVTNYKSLSQLREHMSNLHVKNPNVRYKCMFCRKAFNDVEKLREHCKACFDQEYYFCVYCKYETSLKKDLVYHLKTDHKNLVT